MANPFADAPTFHGELLDRFLIGLQAGNQQGSDGLNEMMNISLGQLREYVTKYFAKVFNLRDDCDEATPSNPVPNDAFICSETFVEEGVTYTKGHFYAYSINERWVDMTMAVKGPKGDTGNGISSIICRYAVTTTQTQPDPADITSETIPAMSATNKYLWQKMAISYTSGDAETFVVLATIYGDTGATGPVGPTGNGISSIVCRYAVTTTQTQPDPADITSETIPAMSATNKYLWQKMVISYTSGDAETFVVLATIYGDTGATGPVGPTGNGISSIVCRYAVTTTQTQPDPADITSETIPAMSATNKYLWQKMVVTYTSGSAETFVVLATIFGDTGAIGPQGIQGPKGDDITVASQSVQYQGSASGTVIPTGTWLDNIPSVPPGEFLWTRIKVTFAPSGEFTAYSVAYQGEDDVAELEAKVESINDRLGPFDFRETEPSSNQVSLEVETKDFWKMVYDQLPTENNDGIFLCMADSAPSGSSSAGLKGQFFMDTDYLYLCIANNTWRRVGLSTF